MMTDAAQARAGDGLPESVKDAVEIALDDEYKAEAFYDAVIEKFGPVRPFVNIVEAERRHARRLENLLTAYGLSLPENGYRTGAKQTPAVPASLIEACQTGVDAEIENAALYEDRLLPAVADYPDIAAAMNDLMSASRDRHLPAFQRCVARGGMGGRGRNRTNR